VRSQQKMSKKWTAHPHRSGAVKNTSGLGAVGVDGQGAACQGIDNALLFYNYVGNI
jgi:hypothetical protein